MALVVSNAEVSKGQIFNITDGVGSPCSEYFGRLADMSGGKVVTMPIKVAAPLANLLGGVLRKVGQHSDLAAGTMFMLNRKGTSSIEKANKLLGYQPLVDMDEGMARVQAWAKEDGLIKG